MRYRIEYADGRCCSFASNRKDLLDWLKTLKDEKVVDIRKVYKNGVTDSVIDSYRSYLKQRKRWTVMVVVKLIIRILLLPVRISLTIVQLVVMFITWLSATVFHILSGIICITAILGYGFGQETGTEMIRMLAVGFLLYVLPIIASWFVVWLETIKIILMGD